MYSNIHVSDTLHITQQLLVKNHVEETIIEEVMDLLHTITSQNYFQHNKQFFIQNDGLPMGSPLSGTLTNIYLNNIEKIHINSNSNKFKNNIVYWHRYVDDILILFKGSIRQLENLHKYINNIHPKIKFTLELENDKTLNFLDLSIQNKNQQHQFKIHRKNTQTSHTIHNTSYHPHQHKLAAYHHLINRLNSIPMEQQDYEHELSTIKQIAIANGFSDKLIHHLNNKHKNRMYQRSLTSLQSDENEQNNKKYITIEYNDITNNTIQKIFRNLGYNIAYKTNHKLQHQLINKQQNQLDCGVYKLTCLECHKFYIGQTGRSFNQRFTEHIQELNHSHSNTITNYKSNFAQHLATERHNYTNMEQHLSIIHKIKKGNTMDRLEEFEIYKERNNPLILNDKLNFRNNKLFDFIWEKSKHQV